MPFDGTQTINPVIGTLQRGRDRVQRGWCQGYGRLIEKSGRSYCAIGAISREDAADHGIKLLTRALGVQKIYDITKWNDQEWRTQADVIALYDRAIELALLDV